jgi:O-antigen/teichoic acid export membrane protein
VPERPPGQSGEGPHELGSLERGALKDHALRGTRWVTVARAVTALLGLASTIVLARLIPPAEFGRAVVALIAVALGTTIAKEGIGASLVQRRSLERPMLEAAFFLSLACGMAATGATLVLAPVAFAPLFGEEIAGLIQLAAPAFLIATASAVPNALLLRALDFRATSIAEVGAAAVGISTSVGMALAGVDAEALVVGGLATVSASTLLTVALAPRPPVPRWDRAAARDITAFGLPATLASVVHSIQENVDYAILAAKLTPAQVGFYWRAFQLGLGAQGKVGGIVMRMAFPLYSRSASLEDLRAARLRITRIHGAVIVPALCLFIPLAPELVPWLFGSDWEAAVEPAQILAVAGMAAALGTGNGPAVLAVGRPGFLLGWHVLRLAVFVAVLLATAPHGLTAVCLGVVGFRLAFLVAGYHVLLGRLVGVPMRRLWADAAPGAVCSIALIAVAFPLTWSASEAGLPVPATVALTSAVGAAVYLVSLRALFPAAMEDVVMVTRAVLAPIRAPSRPPPFASAGTQAGR